MISLSWAVGHGQYVMVSWSQSLPKRSSTSLSISKVAPVPEGYLSVPEGYLSVPEGYLSVPEGYLYKG